ncbi:hypothetical protein SB758_42435, partial [Burkholderia sp. SIMBA_013]
MRGGPCDPQRPVRNGLCLKNISQAKGRANFACIMQPSPSQEVTSGWSGTTFIGVEFAAAEP